MTERAFDVPSPCVGICALDPSSGWCRGCFRTAAEIGAWLQMDAPARRALLARLAEREAVFARRPSAPGPG